MVSVHLTTLRGNTMHVKNEPSIRRRRRRLVVPAAAVLTLTLGLAACGDGDDDEDAAPSATTQASSETTAAETENVGAFCDAIIEADATFFASGPEGPDPAQLQTAFQEVQASAPADIAEDVDQFITLTQEMLSSGAADEGPPPPEVLELDANIDEYVLANCDFAEVEVTGTEYAFEGIPETIETGQTAFNFSNQGGEEHELILVRINDDVTESIEELAQLPEEEAFQKVQPMGFAMAAPGESAQTFVDLEPGRYGTLCFFPVGSTPEALAAAEESGQEIEAPPHFTQGMLAEFTVE
jgi:hypothetical protein